MKAYILTDDDFEQLFIALKQDPKYARHGTTGRNLAKDELEAYHAAHRFYHYHTVKWADKVRK